MLKSRIFALVGDCYGGSGGISRYNQDLFEALSSGGAKVVIAPRIGNVGPGQLPPGIRQLPSRYNRMAYIWMVLTTVIQLGQPDVVFCGHIGMMPVAWLVARLCKARLWLQIHGIEAWPPLTGWRRWCVERADLVTAVSRITRRRLLTWARTSPHEVRVLPNTVRTDFQPGPKSNELLSRYDLAGRRVILTVGRLDSTERSKGHEQVLLLLPRLRQSFPGLVYLIVGSGNDRGRLEEIARRNGLLEDAVRFVGFVPDADLPEHYRVADVFILASSTEGFGIVYVEAARSGLAVIGSVVDGSVDALRDGYVGALVDPNDPASIEAAITSSLQRRTIDPQVIAPFEKAEFMKRANKLLSALISKRPKSLDGG